MNVRQEYQSKLVSAVKAVQAVRSGDWVDYNFALAQPILLDKALAARKEELIDVKIRGGLMLQPLAVAEKDSSRQHFCYNSWHFSSYERKLAEKGLCNYIPMIYRNHILYYRKSIQVDVAMFCVSPMDKHGYFNFSLTNSSSRALAEQANTVILEVNNKLPLAHGGLGNCIHIRDVDYIVEGENPALVTIPQSKPTAVEEKIAAVILEEISDGATIQLGVGGLPNAVGCIIADSGLKDLGVHTEMLVDAYLEMDKAGKITNKRKHTDRGKSVWSFCAGSQELYDWVDNNQGLASYPVDYTNDPQIMAHNEKMISINNCVEVDIWGQVSSETAGSRQISGTGGQLDFLTGGYLAAAGKSFICFTSTFTDKKTGVLKSRINATLPEFSIVSNPRTQAHYLVTEWGKADLAGRSTWERAERIINIAHPDFRTQLEQAAEKLGIWRRTNKIS